MTAFVFDAPSWLWRDAAGVTIDPDRVAVPGSQLQYQTVSVSLRHTGAMSTYAAELDRIAAHGGSVVLCIHDRIPNETGYTFERVEHQRVLDWFALAAARNITVSVIKPHITTPELGDGFHRGGYQPESVPGHFANWAVELDYFADVCETYGVPILCVSCEHYHLTGPDQYPDWETLIGRLRDAHPGLTLTAAYEAHELQDHSWYVVNQPDRKQVGSLLDIYGTTSWVQPLTDKTYTPEAPNITVSELNAAWRTSYEHLPKIETVTEHFGIPYFVLEVGCRPYTDGLSIPPAATPAGDLNHDVQGLLYRSVFQSLTNQPTCVGVSFWHVGSPFNYFNLSDTTVYPGEVAIREVYL